MFEKINPKLVADMNASLNGEPAKQSITIRIDKDVLAWFQAGGDGGYQTRINGALRAFMESQK